MSRGLASPGPRRARTLVVDFDGTITESDVLVEVSRAFGDPALLEEASAALRRGDLGLREAIERELAPVRATLPEVVEWALAHARVRPGFAELVRTAREHGWRVLVLSSGLEELIEPILAREGVEVELVANRADPRLDGWRVLWREQAVCPVCGEECKRSELPEGEVVYVGDGVSDRCAALAADRVFATRGLADYLEARSLPYERFDDFFQVAKASLAMP